MKILLIDDLIAELVTQTQAQHAEVQNGNEDAQPWLAVAAGALHAASQFNAALVRAQAAQGEMQAAREALSCMWPTVKKLFAVVGRELPVQEVDVEEEDPAEGASSKIVLN